MVHTDTGIHAYTGIQFTYDVDYKIGILLDYKLKQDSVI